MGRIGLDSPAVGKTSPHLISTKSGFNDVSARAAASEAEINPRKLRSWGVTMVDADQVITDLTEIFRRTLVDPNFTPTRDMKTGDHPKWDSYANVEILVSCEEHWDFELEPSEIVLVKTFGDMVDVITFKLN